jgi:hypothetical protein
MKVHLTKTTKASAGLIAFLITLALGMLLGMALIKSPAKYQEGGQPVSRPPVLVDAYGKTVGPFVPAYSAYIGALLTVNKHTVVLPLWFDENEQVQSTGLNWLATGRLYQSVDCTGAAYLLILNGAFGGDRLASVSKQGGEYIVNIAADSPVDYLTFQSIQLGDKGGCRSSSERGPAVPVTDVLPLSPYGVPPFRIR